MVKTCCKYQRHEKKGGNNMSLMIDDLVTAIEFDGVKIAVLRAASLYITLRFTDTKGNLYLLKDGEKAVFGVKKYATESEPYMIKKTVDSTAEIEGGYPIILTANDTDIAEGRYYYDVGVQLTDGSFQKSIRASIFLIDKSVTRKE